MKKMNAEEMREVVGGGTRCDCCGKWCSNWFSYVVHSFRHYRRGYVC